MRFSVRAAMLVSGAWLSIVGVPTAWAQIPIPLTVSGNSVQGSITLLDGISLDLTVTFDSATGLTAGALSATATLVDPFDPQLLSRLPGRVGIPLTFPLLLQLEPTPGSGLTFTGDETVALHTPNLELLGWMPLSLVKAPDGGAFQDITTWEGSGSYRVCGSGGSFSSFLIVLDLRDIATVVSGKFVSLQNSLNTYASSITPAIEVSLQGLLNQALSDYQAGNTTAATSDLQAFSQAVVAASGQGIPDVWSSTNPTLVDVAGILRTGADTLAFSIQRQASE